MTPAPSSTASTYFAVCLGGAIGAVARFGVIELIGSPDPARFPWDTLAVNLLGSFLIGLFFGWWRALEVARRSDLPRLFITTGVLGGLTTFSTLSLDTVDLVRYAAWPISALYVIASLVGGFLLAGIGFRLRRG